MKNNNNTHFSFNICVVKININYLLKRNRFVRVNFEIKNVFLLDFLLVDLKMNLLNYQYLSRDHLKGLNEYKVNNLLVFIFNSILMIILV